jgi:hypothetical protein
MSAGWLLFLKTSLAFGLGLALLGVCAWLLGSRLPREHVARVQVELPVPSTAVAARIRDVLNYPKWRRELRGVSLEQHSDGVLRYRETSKEYTLRFERTEPVPEQEFISRIINTDLPFGGHWEFSVATLSAKSSRLTIAEHGFVDAPLWRFFSYYVFGHDTNLKRYADNLARSFADSKSALDLPENQSGG